MTIQLTDLPLIGATLLAWVALVFSLRRWLRHRSDPRLAYLSLLLGVMAVGLSFAVFPADDLLVRIGMPYLAGAIGDGLDIFGTIAGAWASIALCAHLYYDETTAQPKTRRLTLLTLGTLLLIALVQLVGPHMAVVPAALRGDSSSLPFLPVWRVVSFSYLAICAGYLLRFCWSFAHVSRRASVRLGFWLGMTAAVLAEVYVGQELARVFHVPGVNPDRQVWLVVTEASLFALGLILTGWGQRFGLDTAVEWVRNYMALRRIYPLWRRLCRQEPQVALAAPENLLRDMLDVRDVRFRLYRRVVEIWDIILLHANAAPVVKDALRLSPAFQVLSSSRERAPGADLRAEIRWLIDAANLLLPRGANGSLGRGITTSIGS